MSLRHQDFSSSSSGGVVARGPNSVVDQPMPLSVQPDAKRKPYASSQASEFSKSTTRGVGAGAGIPKPTSIAAGFKGSSIASLVSWFCSDVPRRV